MNKIAVGGILELRGLTMIEILGFPNKPGHAGLILTLLGDAEINLHFIAECEDSNELANITICVVPTVAKKALKVINNYLSSCPEGYVKCNSNVAIITIYGPHFREKPAICGKMCYILGHCEVNILGISTSISSVCCIIDDANFKRAFDGLLTVFSLP